MPDQTAPKQQSDQDEYCLPQPFSTKTQKNRLNEMVLLSTQYTCLNVVTSDQSFEVFFKKIS